jgi:hypothetical protein
MRAPPAFLQTVGLALLPRHAPQIDSGGVIADVPALD